jgi:CheY-like chemotaxis protein
MVDKCINIILAEDDPLNQKVALLMLKKLGIVADVAANGLEVLQALEGQPYDVVLMDIQMPEMDGIKATKIIRQRWPRGPRIIVITSCTSDAYRELCFDAGADEFLEKPVKIEELTDAIKRNIPKNLDKFPATLPSISELSVYAQD